VRISYCTNRAPQRSNFAPPQKADDGEATDVLSFSLHGLQLQGVSGTYKFGSEIDITGAMTLAFTFHVVVFPEDSA
jgi:hypothetical protein